MHYAAKHCNLNLANLLLKNKAKIDGGYSATPLHYAAECQESADVASLLVENKADYRKPDGRNLLPLHYAARKGAFEVVKFLLGKRRPGINYDAVNYGSHLTPIICAIEHGSAAERKDFAHTLIQGHLWLKKKRRIAFLPD